MIFLSGLEKKILLTTFLARCECFPFLSRSLWLPEHLEVDSSESGCRRCLWTIDVISNKEVITDFSFRGLNDSSSARADLVWSTENMRCEMKRLRPGVWALSAQTAAYFPHLSAVSGPRGNCSYVWERERISPGSTYKYCNLLCSVHLEPLRTCLLEIIHLWRYRRSWSATHVLSHVSLRTCYLFFWSFLFWHFVLSASPSFSPLLACFSFLLPSPSLHIYVSPASGCSRADIDPWFGSVPDPAACADQPSANLLLISCRDEAIAFFFLFFCLHISLDQWRIISTRSISALQWSHLRIWTNTNCEVGMFYQGTWDTGL